MHAPMCNDLLHLRLARRSCTARMAYSCTKFSTKFSTVCSLKHPWSSPKNFRFRRCRRSNLRIPGNKLPHTKVQYLPSIREPKSRIGGRAVKPARTRRARAMHGENLRKFTKSRALAPYPFGAIICSRTMVQYMYCVRRY